MGPRALSIGTVHFLFVASALVAAGVLAVGYRRDLEAALAGVPLMLGGVAVGFVGVSRFAAARGDVFAGQEIAILAALAAFGLGLVGLGLIGREGLR